MNMKNNKLWYLKNLDIFEGIPEDEMMELAGKVQECMFSKDELIYSPDEAIQSIYVVKRGEVRLYHSKNGKRNVFDVLGPGSLFGGIAFNSDKSTHFAQATHPTKVCIFSEQDFLGVLTKRPELMLRFIKKVTGKIQEYENRLKGRADSAEDVILTELTRLQEKRSQSLFGKWKANGVHITHEELAELTGLNRVTVTRLLKRLKEQKKIATTKAGIELL
ncbi:Crp/Fnr family transcriptional regulator [Candidatus Peregrinibacteria bacterium]|jgi:CRP/FNR family transcriptional regulator, anaerobic regulatory protein|nr:Crp/Fnr family transcriptional regulator [Candidatus Peregrinibacteria bacterium]MBT4632280.1 Crp/Fnr family transcriptional regulator [Candidatus Peregrinibacteria bacterium]MBT5516825.1 Crp/Fnr family transcriptional regulator [Candidatus Peregrinibacteria bacterium]MBT5824309.1 Crp/Fnr family transcriptional regulator [Candidatus Peregrinibacteria bacterium]